MAYITILVIAVILTVFALWRFNVMLSIVSSCGWLAFLFYHKSNLPSGVTAGDVTDTYIVYAAIVMIVAIPVITILRTRSRSGNPISGVEGDEVRATGTRTPTLSSMNTQEYQAYIRSRVRRNRK